MGHTFGLQHASGVVVMCGPVGGNGECRRGVELDDFTPKEELVMKLMLQRLGGNVFPDNDRGVAHSMLGAAPLQCAFSPGPSS
jgi:hypothetical protein